MVKFPIIQRNPDHSLDRGFFLTTIRDYMPIDHVDSWADFGLSGLVIAALFAFVCFLIKEHRSERQEWISAYRDQSKMMDERQSETNSVIRELVAVVKETNVRHG